MPKAKPKKVASKKKTVVKKKKSNLNVPKQNKTKKSKSSTAKKTTQKATSTKKTTKPTAKKTTAPKTTPKAKPTKKTVVPKRTTVKATSTSKTIVKKDEFRKNRDTGHPSYIYRKVGKRYEYIGMTHSEITHKSKNIKLDVNPNPKDKRDAYFRPKTDVAATNRFKDKKEDWSLSDSDKKKAKEIIKKTKAKK